MLPYLDHSSHKNFMNFSFHIDTNTPLVLLQILVELMDRIDYCLDDHRGGNSSLRKFFFLISNFLFITYAIFIISLRFLI